MFRIFFLCICLVYITPSCIEKVKGQKTNTKTAIPVLKILNDTSLAALQIAKLNIDIKVTGNIAITTFDITYYNNTSKILEGEFDFPLADGQSICRYALDINGTLREGVVVEKVKARIAYENTVRRKVDPGLVEKTTGNNFRTRIYPIPANGYKRVVIGIEQTLVAVKEGLLYELPLYADEPVKDFTITAAVAKTTVQPVLQNNTLPDFSFTGKAGQWMAQFAGTNFLPAHDIAFLISEKDGTVYTENHDSITYFYSHIAANPEYKDKPKPSSVTLLWDISASAEKRNIKNELELLSLYIKRLKEITINLVPFNITTLPAEKFVINNGDASGLIQRLQAFSIDGGTQLGSIDLTQFTGEEIMLFTDGLSTFGKKDIVLSTIPVTVINSSPGANLSYLKFIALQTNGRFIQLTATPPETAVNEIYRQPLQFINATYNPTEITGFYPQVNTSLQNGFSFTGILKKDQAVITLHFGFGNKITSSKTITIKDDKVVSGNIKRIWASNKIAWLDLEYEKNKAAITQLGKQFSIVTQNTSLLVLDSVEDYLENDILPPAELQKEYFTLLKKKQQIKIDEKASLYEEAITAMTEMKEWYNRKFFVTKGKIRREVIVSDSSVAIGAMDSSISSTSYLYSANSPAATFQAAAVAEDMKVSDGYVQAAPANMEVNAVQFAPPRIVKEEEQKENTLVADIQLSKWAFESAYLKEMQKTQAAKYVEKYLQLKKDYSSQPSFFVDMARYFFEKNNRPMALQVLSNIAEMKLENPELLRTVANQLIEFDEKELAAEVFKEVLNIREEEPQSYRDLALIYNETGKSQQAIELLYKVILGNWDSRFGSIKAIAMNEMNAIINVHQGKLDLSVIDKKFIQPMPLDVRIVINWNSNDSDIDLWVTDPAKEKCFYENNTTTAGGKISADVTQGYGPEEFCIKKATRGNYTVEVNLYGDSRQTLGGPITIKAELFTNFGRPGQKRKIINCRVTTDKEVIKIGVLHFDIGS